MLVAKYLGSSIKLRIEDPSKILDYLMSSSFISLRKEKTQKDMFSSNVRMNSICQFAMTSIIYYGLM